MANSIKTRTKKSSRRNPFDKEFPMRGTSGTSSRHGFIAGGHVFQDREINGGVNGLRGGRKMSPSISKSMGPNSAIRPPMKPKFPKRDKLPSVSKTRGKKRK